MCNAFRPPKGIDLEHGWHVQVQGDWHWKDEIYPGYPAPVIRRAENGGRECVLARFGLVPWWAKTEKVGWSTMNARSETAAVKPAFKAPFAQTVRLDPRLGDLRTVLWTRSETVRALGHRASRRHCARHLRALGALEVANGH